MRTDLLTKLKQFSHAKAIELGFDGFGVTTTDLGDHPNHLRDWLQQQHHGSMAYMAAHGQKRGSPEKLVPGTLRILSVKMHYPTAGEQATGVLDCPDKAYIARYALGRDYHKLMRKRLAKLAEAILEQARQEYQFRAFVDSAPVLERAAGQQAGLGWIGKNTMLIDSKAGSWFFLGELFTNLPLPTDEAHDSQHCGSCTACLDICPTRAFVKPWILDARRCISYLTIESKQAIPLELRPLLGNRVFGCDDCQLVCPWNKFAPESREPDFQPRHGLHNRALKDLFMWTEEEFLRNTQGSAIRRIGFDGWLRNLAVGLGNAPYDPDIVAALRSRLTYSSELVREHCQWALERQLARDPDRL